MRINIFWEVIYDDENSKFDLKESFDDTLFTNNVSMMIKYGFKIHCQTANINAIPYNSKHLIGYVREEGLYQRLLLEYERESGKVAKRW